MAGALICVYYRLPAAARDAAIAAMREIQRTLGPGGSGVEAELHLRFDLPSPPPRTPSAPADCTLMETYRLPDAARVTAFLAELAARVQDHPALAGTQRHTELFSPCAS